MSATIAHQPPPETEACERMPAVIAGEQFQTCDVLRLVGAGVEHRADEELLAPLHAHLRSFWKFPAGGDAEARARCIDDAAGNLAVGLAHQRGRAEPLGAVA